ncbi:MAG: hypothetical protein ABSH44_10125 [Bryobacteraceae bacterium]|jgi:hypothetical protein
MKRLRSILGNSGAVLTLVLAVLAPFLLFGWFQGAIGAARLHIDPTYSGGEVWCVIEREGYRMVVNHPVSRRLPWQRIGPFVQITWTPADRLPARVSEQIDIDGDGTPDVLVTFDSKNLIVDVTPLGARYRAMHSQGVTSFSALIARVKDGIVVRIPLG